MFKYKPSVNYAKKILKLLLDQLTPDDTSDLCFNYLSELMINSNQLFFHKLYFLPNTRIPIIIKEDTALISKGTTGLSTWGACLLCIEYLSTNLNLLKDRDIIELGSGTGLLSIALSKLGSNNVHATDISYLELRRIQENSKLNELDLECSILNWEFPEINWTGDFIVSTDCVFNPDLILPLLKTISYLLKKSRLKFCLLGLTVRNQETFGDFVNECKNMELNLEYLQSVDLTDYQGWYFYPEIGIIHLIKLH
ncbi:S-adenosyl-L-methionine-dependent methyltransferase [Globomyces pollinis-pini]|nr:S-adenosyl-L-methionine-dependent methyltransferase [Globomyces pollinis-pini]